MGEQETYTLEEAHRQFAVRANGEVWELLGKTDRSAGDDQRMILAAYASLYHWTKVGTEVHRQRGEWLIAHVLATVGDAESALAHAQRCLSLTETYADQMSDFDVAYAYEAMARAHGVAGRDAEARDFLTQARDAGEGIADAQDKKIFMSDLQGGDWHGIA